MGTTKVKRIRPVAAGFIAGVALGSAALLPLPSHAAGASDLGTFHGGTVFYKAKMPTIRTMGVDFYGQVCTTWEKDKVRDTWTHWRMLSAVQGPCETPL